MKSIFLAAIFALVPLLLGSPLLHAQDVDPRQTAMARSLFEEGVSFADRNQWSEAADRFERALQIRDSSTIRFNLATAYEHLGRLVEASEQLTRVARDSRADARVQSSSSALLAQIRPRVAHLIVRVTGATEGVRYELDGRALPSAAIGVLAPVDPGPHSLRALRGTEELARASVDASSGAEASVTLELPAEAPAIDPSTAARAETSSDSVNVVVGNETPVVEDDRSSTPWGWIVVGGVAVVAAVVVTLIVTGGSSREPVSGDSNPAVLQW